MADEAELADLMEQASSAFEVLLGQICLDPVDVTGQVVAGDDPSIDLLATTSSRDKATLRGEGAVAGLRILARLVGVKSAIARVSIQVDD